MKTEQNIMELILTRKDKLSKGHKKIAEYILEHGEDATFMTAAELGATLEISESTVVRFADKLGLKGYPELQDKLQEWTRNKLQTVTVPEFSAKTMDHWGVIATVLQSDMQKIHDTLEGLSEESFASTVDSILAAKHVYIVGLRNSAPLASFFYFYLNMIRRDVILLDTTSSTEMFEQMIRIDEEDVFIGISFPRYSMRTLKAMEFARDRRAKVIAITDSVHSPMTMYSSLHLLAKSELNGVADSLVAPFSLLNALIVAMCLKNPEQVKDELKNLEDVWSNYQVYTHDEINYLNKDISMSPRMRKEYE